MTKKNPETWVGIFVVIGILLLAFMTLKIEKFQIGRETGYRLNIFFDSAGGLSSNAQVRVAGVRVGGVEKVALEGGKAKVIFRVPKHVVLYKDAKAYLKSEGFLGEKYVEITPGTAGNPKVEPNGVIDQGAPPIDVEQFLSKMSSVGEDIKEVVKPVNDLLKAVDPKKVEGMVDNLNQFSGQLKGIASDSTDTLRKAKEAFSSLEDIGEKVIKGEGALGKLITDETLYRDAKEVVEKVKETAETLKNVSEKIERGEGTLGKLVQDESLYTEAKETLQSIKGMAAKIEKGEGTLGKLINDDTLVKETEKTMKKVQKAAEGIQEQTPITVLGTIIGLFF
jgi:phospholipid/cholesterol/gamma-HCH transport system substrate-binding protein